MKFLLLLSLFTLASCGLDKKSDNLNLGIGESSKYGQCEDLPYLTVVTMEEYNCPGSPGTWNNYQVETTGLGALVKYEVWCGGTDQEHPESQNEYNAGLSSGSSTSNDFRKSTDCVSGSYVNSAEHRIANIWRKI